MTDKVVTLLSTEKIRANLAKVDSLDYMQEKFHPLIAKEGGRDLVPMGIIMMLNLAIYDFAQNYPPMVGNMLLANVPAYIDCVTDNKDAASEAKAIWEKIQSSTKGGEA